MEYKLFGIKFRVEIVLIAIIIGMIMGGHLLCSCSRISLDEGFEIGGDMLNILTDKLENGKKQVMYSKKDSSVIMPSETSDLNTGSSSMDFFENTKFTPEACPNTYSSSTGCATFGPKQITALATRGGNNVAQSII
jgi:hypothetical protein